MLQHHAGPTYARLQKLQRGMRNNASECTAAAVGVYGGDVHELVALASATGRLMEGAEGAAGLKQARYPVSSKFGNQALNSTKSLAGCPALLWISSPMSAGAGVLGLQL
jgi:hypothetical protein